MKKNIFQSESQILTESQTTLREKWDEIKTQEQTFKGIASWGMQIKKDGQLLNCHVGQLPEQHRDFPVSIRKHSTKSLWQHAQVTKLQ